MTDVADRPAPAADRVPNTLLTTDEAAARLGCSRDLLYTLRHLDLGPPSVKRERGRLGYDQALLDEWEANLRGPLHEIYSTEKLIRLHAVRKKRLGGSGTSGRKRRGSGWRKRATPDIPR